MAVMKKSGLPTAEASTEKKMAETKVTDNTVKTVGAKNVKKPLQAKKETKDTEEVAGKLDKKVEVKKPAVKKPAAKKATGKKAATTKNTAVKESFVLQFMGRECTKEDMIARLHEIWTKDFERNINEISDMVFYVKPEESAVYYVVNKDITGKFDI
ncbi:MAG: DUF6465 family protein [Lachnospiraceae bacterium]|nr:DUF6465 family protein [Lachnospiraceae bacterium]